MGPYAGAESPPDPFGRKGKSDDEYQKHDQRSRTLPIRQFYDSLIDFGKKEGKVATDVRHTLSEKEGKVLKSLHPPWLFHLGGRDRFLQFLDKDEPRLFIGEPGNTLVDLFDRGWLRVSAEGGAEASLLACAP